jgi:HK97 family phage portal protein
MPSVPAVRERPSVSFAAAVASALVPRAATPTQPPQAVGDRGSWWWPVIREPYTGAWQRNMEERVETVLTYHAVYSCVTLIASDVAKCRLRLVERDKDGIWTETESPSFSPVLRKPNRFQNRIKFIEQWVVSKLLHGNTYVLKRRDNRNVVVALYILDPLRTKVLVANDGSVFYQISRDNLSGVEEESVAVPASEIIHDVMVPLYHPLCGVSPLTACGVAAVQGLAIQRNSSKFFQNGSRPGGILTAPNTIDDVTAARLKKHWEDNYSGENIGRVAVLGDGLKYESMSVNPEDAQLIEQLKWSAETVCSAFHVPAYKVGVGAAPAYNNIEALDQQYYAQCLQKLFECIELCLDEGLGLTEVPERKYGTEFDLDDLLRMDTATLVKSEVEAVGGGIKKPNEARKRMNLAPVKGGDTPYLQQQNYSLAALDKRDRQDNPFPQPKPEPDPNPEPVDLEAAKQFFAWRAAPYVRAMMNDARDRQQNRKAA